MQRKKCLDTCTWVLMPVHASFGDGHYEIIENWYSAWPVIDIGSNKCMQPNNAKVCLGWVWMRSVKSNIVARLHPQKYRTLTVPMSIAQNIELLTSALSGITIIFIPDKEPKYWTLRLNTGHLRSSPRLRVNDELLVIAIIIMLLSLIVFVTSAKNLRLWVS